MSIRARHCSRRRCGSCSAICHARHGPQAFPRLDSSLPFATRWFVIAPMKKLLVLVSCVAAVSLAAQAPQQPEPVPQAQTPIQGPTFRTGVDVIAVDVAVVDDRGKPVADLLPPDFAVKIDGQLRRVVSAEQVRIDVEAARKQAANPFETLYTTNLVPANGRMIVLAVDQGQIRIGAARALLATAVKFLDMLSPADRTAFVSFPEPGVYVDFTNDKLKLKLAMERVVGNQQRYTGKFNIGMRSEEHTSELQSPCNLVCRLLLEKKKYHINRLKDT